MHKRRLYTQRNMVILTMYKNIILKCILEKLKICKLKFLFYKILTVMNKTIFLLIRLLIY